MKLKRIYENDVCTGVHVIDTGIDAAQNFSARLVSDGLLHGWITLSGTQMLMKTDEGDALRFEVKRVPGYYCASNGEKIPVSQIAWERMLTTGVGDLTRREALAWLEAAGKAETDYEVTLAYECLLDAEQHEANKVEA